MKYLDFLLLTIPFIGCGQQTNQNIPPESEMVSMNDASVSYQGGNGPRYYSKDSDQPYTGWLSARYDNGQLESISQVKDGYGNGIWINFDPDGRKESQGTLKNNKTIGPAKLYYEDGSLKAEGNYVHLKIRVGLWKFYDRNGKVVSERYFTR